MRTDLPCRLEADKPSFSLEVVAARYALRWWTLSGSWSARPRINRLVEISRQFLKRVDRSEGGGVRL